MKNLYLKGKKVEERGACWISPAGEVWFDWWFGFSGLMSSVLFRGTFKSIWIVSHVWSECWRRAEVVDLGCFYVTMFSWENTKRLLRDTENTSLWKWLLRWNFLKTYSLNQDFSPKRLWRGVYRGCVWRSWALNQWSDFTKTFVHLIIVSHFLGLPESCNLVCSKRIHPAPQLFWCFVTAVVWLTALLLLCLYLSLCHWHQEFGFDGGISLFLSLIYTWNDFVCHIVVDILPFLFRDREQ